MFHLYQTAHIITHYKLLKYMEKLSTLISNNPRTNTPRRLSLTGLTINFDPNEGVNCSVKEVTLDLQGEELLHNPTSPGIYSNAETPGVVDKNVTAHKALQAEIITMLEGSGLIKKLFDLEVKIYESKNKS